MEDIVIAVDKMLDVYPKAVVKAGFEKLLYNGNAMEKFALDFNENTKSIDFDKVEKIRIYDNKEHFIAIYKYDIKHDLFKPDKMFFDNTDLV